MRFRNGFCIRGEGRQPGGLQRGMRAGVAHLQIVRLAAQPAYHSQLLAVALLPGELPR